MFSRLVTNEVFQIEAVQAGRLQSRLWRGALRYHTSGDSCTRLGRCACHLVEGALFVEERALVVKQRVPTIIWKLNERVLTRSQFGVLRNDARALLPQRDASAWAWCGGRVTVTSTGKPAPSACSTRRAASFQGPPVIEAGLGADLAPRRRVVEQGPHDGTGSLRG